MTQHFLIRRGHQVFDSNDQLLGEEGDIIALDTDSDNPAKRQAANGCLKRAGGSNAVIRVDAPEKPKAKKKKGSYKTREMTSEEPEVAPEEPEAAPEEPEAEAPVEDEAG